MDDRVESDVLDLRGVDLAELAGLPESVFSTWLRRVLAESADPGAAYTSFDSQI